MHAQPLGEFMLRTTLMALCVCASSLFMANTANAALVISASEDAGNVVFTYSGSIDLTGLTSTGTFFENRNAIFPGSGGLFSSGAGQQVALYTGGTLPAFGSGIVFAGTGTGDVLNISTNNVFGLATDYVSGAAINGSLTIIGATFASMGLFEGTFTSTLSNSETISMVIGDGLADPVPLPAAAFLFAPALGGIIVARRRKAAATQ